MYGVVDEVIGSYPMGACYYKVNILRKKEGKDGMEAWNIPAASDQQEPGDYHSHQKPTYILIQSIG